MGVAGALLAAVALWWASLYLAPDRTILHILGHAFSGAQLRHVVVERLAMFVLILPAIFAIEIAFTGWADSSLRLLLVVRTPSSRTDLASFVFWRTPIRGGLVLVLSLGVTLISGLWLHDRLRVLIGYDLSAGGLPMPAQVALLFFVYSFFDYWNHRLDHASVFWPLHRYHHAAEDFDILNSVRTHPAVFSGVISNVLPAALLGFSVEALIYVNLLAASIRYLVHSRIDSDFGWVGRYLIQSPVHHRLHHVLDTSEPTGHFALVPLWDHLFGTWRGAADQSLVIGVDAPYRHGAWLVPDVLRDYRDFWLTLATGLGALRLTDQAVHHGREEPA